MSLRVVNGWVPWNRDFTRRMIAPEPVPVENNLTYEVTGTKATLLRLYWAAKVWRITTTVAMTYDDGDEVAVSVNETLTSTATVDNTGQNWDVHTPSVTVVTTPDYEAFTTYAPWRLRGPAGGVPGLTNDVINSMIFGDGRHDSVHTCFIGPGLSVDLTAASTSLRFAPLGLTGFDLIQFVTISTPFGDLPIKVVDSIAGNSEFWSGTISCEIVIEEWNTFDLGDGVGPARDAETGAILRPELFTVSGITQARAGI